MAPNEVPVTNPLDGTNQLHQPTSDHDAIVHPQHQILPGDSATTKAEKIERHGGPPSDEDDAAGDLNNAPTKRQKLEEDASVTHEDAEQPGRRKGVAPIKKEYLIDVHGTAEHTNTAADDDAAEASGRTQTDTAGGRGGQKTKGGQNHARQFGSSRDAIELCRSRALVNEFSPITCSFGSKCKHEHDIRRYLKDGKREDLQTFNTTCPIWEARGRCNAGWRCRFASSHSQEVEHDDGRKELVLKEPSSGGHEANGNGNDSSKPADQDEDSIGVVNIVPIPVKITLRKKKHPTPKSDKFLHRLNQQQFGDDGKNPHPDGDAQDDVKEQANAKNGEVHDNRASFVEAPLLPSEKRRIYYGPETPVLAPLTTQGNLPFRRLCVTLGAQVTWSEMAMGLPLIQGEKQEWALAKAHESELMPPTYNPQTIVQDYDNSQDFRFGVQIAANKPWLALKSTEVLTDLCPRLRAIDLNGGCPIDLVFRQGGGSALLDTHGKLSKMLRGMNYVSKEVPITVKIRMGTRDKQPNAEKLIQRLVLGASADAADDDGPAGVAAITLHGRSRQQRYTRSADWEYIASCAALIAKLKTEHADVTDTVREPDPRDLAVTSNPGNLPYFCGNGDVLSHVDYNTHISEAKVASCMIARGALIKPWIFEEIATNQYLDKSASERLGYIERFVRNGLEYWGSDEIGVGTTRRFLLEWLSFSCRYVPVGLLEYLPPRLGDRPPAYKGRSDLETLLSSGNYKDWIRISEMFLGPAHKDFNFQPKHKSNSYEIEAEG